MTRVLALVFTLLLVPGFALAQTAPATAPAQAPAAPVPSPKAKEVSFYGKLYCPLKVPVLMPMTAYVTSVAAEIGQKVDENQTLATVQVPTETRIEEKRLYSQAQVKELEYRLSVNTRDIDRVKAKREELDAMAKQNMAARSAIEANAKELASLEKQRAALIETQNLENQLSKSRLDLAKDRYGNTVNPQALPHDALVRSPVGGYVLWVSSELQKGGKINQGTVLFQVGTMDPLVIRAQAHEIEAQRLNIGDVAKVTFDAIPGETFEAKVSRIPWAAIPSHLQQPSYYEIELTMPNPKLRLREGLKAMVTIVPSR